MSVLLRSPLPISTIEEIIEMDNAATGKVTCVGFATSQKRRCRNRIAASNQSLAIKTIESLPQLIYNHTELLRALQYLASLTLCRRYHQDQARSTVQNWFRTIVQESNAQYVPLTRSPPQPSYNPPISPQCIVTTETATYASTTSTTVYAPRTYPGTRVHRQHFQWQRDTVEYIPPVPQLTLPSAISQRNVQPRARILALTSPEESSPDQRNVVRAINEPASQAVITQAALPISQPAALPAELRSGDRVEERTVPSPEPETRINPIQPRARTVEAVEEVQAQPRTSATTVLPAHSHAAASHDEALTEEEEEDVCYVCYLPFSDPVETPCGHKFCRECIGVWLVNNRTCPYDRRPLQAAQLVAVETEVACNICYEGLTIPCRTPCGHIFCRECITTWLRSGSRKTCPMDRRPLREDELVDVDENDGTAERRNG